MTPDVRLKSYVRKVEPEPVASPCTGRLGVEWSGLNSLRTDVAGRTQMFMGEFWRGILCMVKYKLLFLCLLQ